MKISTSMLKRFIPNLPSDDVLFELTNDYIIEVESIKSMLDVNHLVVGYVDSKEKHPNSDHLSVCQVNLGDDKLTQIVCGASNVDKGQYVVVAKVGAILPGDFEIKEAAIRGVESFGMICSLNELNVDEKHIEERFKDGIYYFDFAPKVGSNALDALNFNQSTLELELTPNRADLLSVLGFAYDLAAVLNEKVIVDEPELNETGEYNPLSVSILDEGCKRYYARYVDQVVVKPSPMWMQADLIASGIRPINNVVDITNYVLLEYGTPLHAFDADKFGSTTIVVKSGFNETVVGLDDEKRDIKPEDIIITNGKHPAAIGGVMGLLNTAVSDETTKVILEAAWFEPSRIRETSRRLDLISDSSIRFERGVDEIRVKKAINRAAYLLEKYAGVRVYKETAFEGKPFEKPTIIKINEQDVNRLLGTNLTNEDISNILRRLSIIETKPNQYLIPSHRNDLKIKADLVEEIGRIYGYNNIDTKVPTGGSIGRYSDKQVFVHKIRRQMANLGFNEVINYSLDIEKTVSMYTHPSKDIIKMLHPISDDRKVLRHSLINALVRNVEYHLSRQMQDIHLFEIGRAYFSDQEPTYLSAIINGRYISNSLLKNDINSSYYLIKGILENVLENFNVSVKYEVENTLQGYHPGVCAKIVLDKETIGYIGKIHPSILKDAYAFEINLEKVFEILESQPTFESISKFPNITRDLAVLVDKMLPVQKMIDLITQTMKRYLVDIELFDLYEDDKLGIDKKSVAFRMTFNAKTQTLETQDIDKMMRSLMIRFERELKAEIRK